MRRILSLLLLLFFVSNPSLFAQETTATLNGSVSDPSGNPVSGATITIKHEPTGYVTNSLSNNKGLFVVPNLKVGGPYTITVSFVGFQDEVNHDVNLILGENPDLNISLKSSS